MKIRGWVLALTVLTAGIAAAAVCAADRMEKRGAALVVPGTDIVDKISFPTEQESAIDKMSLEEKVAQLFIVTPEALTGGAALTSVDSTLESAYGDCPAGGFILMQGNIETPEQVKELNEDLLEMSREQTGLIPFLGVDEEGGTVARIASDPDFPVENAGNMSDIGKTEDPSKAYQAGAYIGSYLREYGFNVDFAPDADVWSNEANTVVRYRAFSSDPSVAAEMTAAETEGLMGEGIWSVLKHFPGHGNTTEDSHDGFAYSEKTLEELRQCEFLPFEAGIRAGSPFVMVGHISLPEVTGDDLPASLSKTIITELLRGELEFDGVVVTDAMNMGAIAEHYSSAEAAVMAVQAGADMILMPADFEAAYNGILQAVQEGQITEERLDRSVERILDLKLKEE
ncbi:MAG TPA: glycoside hydrolase family 3 protein [Candidatus Mediterraneibacter norfolkensis]|nr:glycoside hydrolase family 3 protein [Candidatus Mediterraneibacter norfolkensis]